MSPGRALVIVESPAKAKTIAGFLGDDYVVESSIGHIRDLPAPRRRRPRGLQGGGVGPARRGRRQRLQAALRRLRGEAKDQVRKLKALLKDAERAYLATDEDREGESIAWHLLEVLSPQGPGQADGLPRDHPARPSSGR